MSQSKKKKKRVLKLGTCKNSGEERLTKGNLNNNPKLLVNIIQSMISENSRCLVFQKGGGGASREEF